MSCVAPAPARTAVRVLDDGSDRLEATAASPAKIWSSADDRGRRGHQAVSTRDV